MVVGRGCSTKTTSDTHALDLSHEFRVCARTRARWEGRVRSMSECICRFWPSTGVVSDIFAETCQTVPDLSGADDVDG